jgi:phenylalanyl-tRNA synthetase beta chain
MRISWQWLGEYVDLHGMTPRTGAEVLTMSGTKIEAVDEIDVSAIVIGRVLEQREHPRSRSPLWIHQVDIGGGEVRQIIAGASNAIPGTLVPVALPGTTVPNGKEVRDASIAGEAGQGMLCSAEELKLGEPERAIMLLDEGEPGEPLSKYFPVEAVFEAEITPNRPDCLGHLGVARELAAAARVELRADFMPRFTEGESPPAGDLIRVSIDDPDLCARYIGAPITGARVGPSPAWMQRRLRACGVRPISNVVDVTAYVMLEYGQPLHAFDLRKLEGPEIRVRRARAGEALLCLDGETRQLDRRMLVIADARRPVAIAGVIGGEESGVTSATVDVLLESANFEGVNVRATTRALNLRTEASARFEKGLPPELAQAAARRAAALIGELAGGKVHREWEDAYPRPQQPIRVAVDPAEVDAILGVQVAEAEQDEILRRLGFMVRREGEGFWDVLPPVWRLDVKLREDVAEEIGRLHGIDRIPATLPGRRHSRWTVQPPGRPEERLREVLLGAGFDEAVTPALVARRLLDSIGAGDRAVSLTNPMSEDLDTMRTSLLPSLLLALERNASHGVGDGALFEQARVYMARPNDPEGLADEPLRLTAVALAGDSPEAGRAGFLRLKAVADRLAHEVSAPQPTYSRSAPAEFHPGRTATIAIEGREVGVVGELHPSLLGRFDLDDARVVALDIDVDRLIAAGRDRKARSLPRFPSIERDLAVVVSEDTPAAALLTTIRAAGGPLLEHATAFDEYRSQQIGEGVKSIAFALTFRSRDRTLTDAEVDQTMAAVRRQLAQQHGARGR